MEHAVFEEHIKNVIQPLVEKEGFDLVQTSVARSSGNLLIRVLVDRKEGGITVDECAQLSRLIGDLLEVDSTVQDRYLLEVASPGLDRPLKTKKDFERNVGKEIKFFLNQKINEKLEWDGVIKEVSEVSVLIEASVGDLELPLVNINTAKQIIS